jgi:hypothetical protein
VGYLQCGYDGHDDGSLMKLRGPRVSLGLVCVELRPGMYEIRWIYRKTMDTQENDGYRMDTVDANAETRDDQ